MKTFLAALNLGASVLFAPAASATLVVTPTGPFAYLDSASTAHVVSTNSQGSIGVGFAPNGALIRSDGSNFYVHSLTADTTYHGANTIRSSTTTPMTGDGIGGAGFTYRPQDGFYYAQSNGGPIKKIDPVTFASTSITGTTTSFYGMHLLPNGNLVFNTGNTVQLYDFATNTQSTIYDSGTFNDDIAVDPTSGDIFVAALGVGRVDVLKPDGTWINSFTSPNGHVSDGLAYGQGAIFGNNTDGSITRIDFSGPGYTGTGTETLIASGAGYGDNAAVGPDGSFYVSNTSARLPDGYSEGWDVIQISLVGGGGFGDTTEPSNNVPEPASMVLLTSSLLGLGGFRRRRAR